MKGRIHLFGAGGHAREVHRLLRDLVAHDPATAWEPAGFLVDEGWQAEEPTLKGLPIKVGEAAWPDPDDGAIVVAVGASLARERIVRRLEQLGHRRFPTLVHPVAWVAPDARLGDGCVVFAGALINTDTSLAEHVHVNLGASISHDSVLQAFVTLGPGVRVCGNVHIGAAADLGAGAVLIPRAQVGARALVGAGTVVIDKVPAAATAVGVPARITRRHES